MKRLPTWLWLLCLAALAVGLRNFETGLSADGPLYGAIARNIARSGELFLLDAQVADLHPYVEHTHLGFWVLAAFLKIFPAQDWALRIPGHLFYLLFMSLYFVWLRRRENEGVATLGVLLLWSWSTFSNYFSNAYLDPGALCAGFGALIVFPRRAALSGLLLAMCFMFKGLTVLGFGPLFVWTLWHECPDWRSRFRQSAVCLASAAALLGLYWFSIRLSNAPDFLSLYWQRQMNARFLPQWDWSQLWGKVFWLRLLQDTYFLLPLAFFAFRRSTVLATLWAATFAAMYAPAGRIGFQYWLMLMPPFAWLIAVAITRRSPDFWNTQAPSLQRWSAVTALVLLALLQYIPFRAHATQPPAVLAQLRPALRRLHLDHGHDSYFIAAAPYAWYADVRVDYVTPVTLVSASDDNALLLQSEAAKRYKAADLARKNWCARTHEGDMQLWEKCP